MGTATAFYRRVVTGAAGSPTALFVAVLFVAALFVAALMVAVPFVAALLVAAPAGAQSASPVLSRSEEIALAEGAGPGELAAAATIWVRGEEGYEIARQGTNGGSCLVTHDRPDTVEPICFDAEGTRAILPVYLERERLRASGMSDEQIEARIQAGFDSGEYGPPAKPGIAYMLSAHNLVFNGSEVIGYPPHIMVYAPYATNADIGADQSDRYLPWVLNEGEPHAYIIVVVGGR